MELTVRNNISIAQIVLFLPFLAVAIILCVRHGFGSNAGWLFLVLFSLFRIVGASLQLAATANPRNIGLFVGALTLQSIGLSDFIIVLLALLNRALGSMKKGRNAIVNPRVLFLSQLLVFVGVILGSVGGSNSGSRYAETGEYKTSTLTEAGISLTIAGFVLLVIATITVGLNVSYADPGEKRVVLAVALSLPFLLVRVIYSAAGTFNRNSVFNNVSGDAYVFLGTAVIEEIIIVLIIEAIGLTLQVRPKTNDPSSQSPLLRLFGHLRGRYGNYEMERLNQSEHRNSGAFNERVNLNSR
ncbi:hypothetical protein E0Z10_g10008 [Xylaria hypoxylon]|uniref:DUF7702 domain-containing protein n=1 Tax=Xylaria hypoxylon TaxID=37992 RepID=A0A4Z0Y4S0_9PEZI|nr:hypothetical protein E0Z10_g10008 [Xylaria hypoxylon]